MLAVLVGVNLYVFLWRGDTSIPAVMEQAAMAGNSEMLGPELPSDAELEAALADEAGAEVWEETWIDGEVQSGDSMGGILRREGMSPGEADELVRALRDHMDLRKIRPGQGYRLLLDPNKAVRRFEFQVSPTVKVRASRAADGSLSADTDKAVTEMRVEEIGGHIESSLYAAIKTAGEDTGLVAFFVDVFAYDINFFTETRRGDKFRMVVEKEYLDGTFLRYRRVLAAEYSGHVGTYQAFWWKVPGAHEGHYFGADGSAVEKGLLKTPLKFSRISSKFNMNRMHPVLHKQRAHLGVDYAAPTGTPVWAAAGGRIVYRGWRGGAGNCVIIKHDNGLQTVYMHLSKFRAGQQVGQRVKSKTVVGYVGSTGLATGPHLHFAVKQNGHYIDPMTLKMARGPGVPRKHLGQFKAETGLLVERLARIPTNRVTAVAAADEVDDEAGALGADEGDAQGQDGGVEQGQDGSEADVMAELDAVLEDMDEMMGSESAGWAAGLSTRWAETMAASAAR
ncbi:peptidoglycan DD-metalloendopeptidase family protein [Haliangium sp.]|uniref:M23 family metallopeptidase n=1 Tax=Haliangium sp. TaxID=2663208 RepID=UPI003D09FD88